MKKPTKPIMSLETKRNVAPVKLTEQEIQSVTGGQGVAVGWGLIAEQSETP